MRFVIAYLSFLVPIVCCSQNFKDYTQINYSVDDGLPSNECHEVLQDGLGYIWVATDRGLVRYDGYGFKTYGISEGLLDISCLNLLEDSNSNLWTSTYSGRIFKYNIEKDSISLYKHQSVIDSFLPFSKILDFKVDHKSTMYISVAGLGLLEIQPDGQWILDRQSSHDNFSSYFTKRIDDDFILCSNSKGDSPLYLEKNSSRPKLDQNNSIIQFYLEHEQKEIKGVIDFSIDNSNVEAFLLNDTLSLLTIAGVNYYCTPKGFLVKKQRSEYEDIHPINDSGYLSAEVNKLGIKYFRDSDELINGLGQTILPEVSATSIHIDVLGNIWISTLDRGLFKLNKYLINSGAHLEKGEKITSIENGDESLFYIKNKTDLVRINSDFHSEIILHDNSSRLHSITFDPFNEELIICKNKSRKLSSNGLFKNILYNTEETNATFLLSETDLLKAFCFAKDVSLTIQPDNFFLYQDLDLGPIYSSHSNNRHNKILGACMIEENHFLLGTVYGLLELKDLHLTEPGSYPDDLKVRINDIQNFNGFVAFATQGNGLVFWDLENRVIKLNVQSGLVSNIIEKLYVSDDNIYLCTKSGLTKVWFDDTGKINSRNYTRFHGLPSNEVNDVTSWNDTIYIATGNGIAKLSEESEIANKHSVLIENVLVKNLPINNINNLRIPFSNNNVTVQYKTLDFGMHGDIWYRSRLNDNPWTESRSTYTNFAALQPDNYTFEVQSKNVDNAWSDSTELTFTINSPWWKSKLLFILGSCLFGFLIYRIYERRTGFLKNKLEVEREIRDLERAALQSQMNPHFIFNCLNSIQSFIIKNEKEEAMEYLAKFAHLIRGNLNASSENRISLDQEVRMLDNYLALEKLRLSDSFNYTIQVDPSLDLLTTRFPPMLVQPFVENAVIHGMKKKTMDGLIEISFSRMNEDHLLVVIFDNGQTTSSVDIKPQHKSFGMSITSKRLAYINNQSSKDYRVTPTHTDQGTEVRITIAV